MFDQLKDLYTLKKQAQEMQTKLATQKVTGSSKNSALSITINGNQDVESVSIRDREKFIDSDIEKTIKEALEDTQHQLRNLLASQFKDMLT